MRGADKNHTGKSMCSISVYVLNLKTEGNLGNHMFQSPLMSKGTTGIQCQESLKVTPQAGGRARVKSVVPQLQMELIFSWDSGPTSALVSK